MLRPFLLSLLASSLSLAVYAESKPLTAKQLQHDQGILTAQGLSGVNSPSSQSQLPATVSKNDDEDDTAVDLLEEYNVTANRRRQAISETSESVTIITRSDIEALTPLAQTLPDLLRIVPGIQAGGSSPFEPAFSIRGLGDGRSAVFIDGERQNISQGDDRADLFSLNPQDIERIEILRGPASGTYGADVVGGLVNVITRKPQPGDPTRLGFQTSFGGFSAFNQALRLSTGGDGYALNASINYSSLGDGVDGLGTYLPNQQDKQTYTAKLRLFPSPNDRVTLSYAGSRLHTGVIAIANFAEGERFSVPLLGKDRLGVEWNSQKIFNSATDFKLSVFYNRTAQNYIQQILNAEDPSITDFNEQVTSTVNTLGTNVQFNTPIGKGNLTYGLDFFRESGTNASLVEGSFLTTGSTAPIVPDGTQTGIAGYVLLNYPLTPDVIVNGGLRYDATTTTAFATDTASQITLNNTALTPKFGLVWNFAPGLRFRANYSQGFRVPSFRERFFSGFAGPLNADLDDVVFTDALAGVVAGYSFLQGNPNLAPLRANSFDIGFGGGNGTTSWDAVYFNNSVQGLLSLASNGELVAGSAPVLVYENINARFQGVELQGTVQFNPEWRLRSSFTWTNAIEEQTQQQLSSVAPTFGALQLSYRNPSGLSALLQARVSSARPGFPAFGVVDLNFGLPIAPTLQLTLTVSNLLGSYYAESVAGKYAPDRQIFIGLRGGDW